MPRFGTRSPFRTKSLAVTSEIADGRTCRPPRRTLRSGRESSCSESANLAPTLVLVAIQRKPRAVRAGSNPLAGSGVVIAALRPFPGETILNDLVDVGLVERHRLGGPDAGARSGGLPIRYGCASDGVARATAGLSAQASQAQAARLVGLPLVRFRHPFDRVICDSSASCRRPASSSESPLLLPAGSIQCRPFTPSFTARGR